MSLVVALLAAATSTCMVPSAEEAAQRSMPYAAFDGQTGPYGWRALAAAGCTDTAVSILAHYAEANRIRLAPAQRREIAFHIGQALAMAGREQEAIAPFERALDPEAPAEWATYVEATLAFLRRDEAALQAARTAYAALAPGSVRLRIIDGLLACPTEPYMKATHCRMKALR
jgi:tetratricopeptide (TPR) repeat protein